MLQRGLLACLKGPMQDRLSFSDLVFGITRSPFVDEPSGRDFLYLWIRLQERQEPLTTGWF
jgi:hypothetical protein